MQRRIIAAILLILVLIPLAACGEGRGGEGKREGIDTNETNPLQEGGTQSSGESGMYDKNGFLLDRVPDNIDYGDSEVVMLYWSDRQYQEFFADTMTGDNINDAIFNRNLKVEERIGGRVKYVGEPGNAGHYATFAQRVVNDIISGSGEFDIVAGYSLANASLAVNGHSADLMEYDTIFAFDLPWWPSKMVKEATISNKLYFATGDISTNLILMLQATYFNKNMVADLGLESLYDLVREGKWTLDKMIEMSTGVYSDENGNGNADENDIFGFTLSSNSNAYDTAFYGAGLITMEKDQDDIPYISEKWNSEKTADVLSKLCNFFYESDDVYAAIGTKIFADGRCLFEFASLNAAFISFVGLDIYGIVPPPKYDIYQENYSTAVSTPHTLYSISLGSDKREQCAYLIECLASEGHRTVTPEVFNITLQTKYASDEDTGIMLDILREGVVFEVGKAFSYAFGNLTLTIWRNCLKNNNPNFAWPFKAQSKVIENHLKIFINDFAN